MHSFSHCLDLSILLSIYLSFSRLSFLIAWICLFFYLFIYPSPDSRFSLLGFVYSSIYLSILLPTLVSHCLDLSILLSIYLSFSRLSFLIAWICLFFYLFIYPSPDSRFSLLGFVYSSIYLSILLPTLVSHCLDLSILLSIYLSFSRLSFLIAWICLFFYLFIYPSPDSRFHLSRIFYHLTFLFLLLYASFFSFSSLRLSPLLALIPESPS